MMRVVVCSGQSSGWLWRSVCHNLTMTGLPQLTMGSGPGLQRGCIPWGPKHSEVTILLMVGSTACDGLTSWWEAMVMAWTRGGA
uniref:Uncharacterized protein n=1 Tax=Romanomermis culicivorax TaxID=13658 RepID=A0A915IIN7_ROMCU